MDSISIEQTEPDNPSLMIFSDCNGETGRLDVVEGQFVFSGNAEYSAQLFFNWLQPYLDSYLAQRKQFLETMKEIE